MCIHDMSAIGRKIQFKKNEDVHVDVRASQQCCWNCHWSIMTYDNLWCECEMDEVDFRDLCYSWAGELQNACAQYQEKD